MCKYKQKGTNNVRKPSLLSVLLVFLVVPSIDAKEYLAATVDDIHDAMRRADPGDVVILRNGRWNDATITLEGNGNAQQPILVKAEQPGKVILTGNSSLSVNGSYITISGLLFTDGYLQKGHVIKLNGHHQRLTNSAIIAYNPPNIDTRYFWVSLTGREHRVDHNRFTGQNHSGVTTVVWLKGDSPGYHQIDSNYYGQRAKGNGNGFETIRIGTGANSTVNAHVLVEKNLFEALDGEMEIISNKSNDNTYRHNTFLRSAGTLTLRQGKRCVVDGNFFLGEGKKGTGGIRVIGEQHLIVNNYIEGTTGRANGAISVNAGTARFSSEKHTAYPQVRDVVVAFNTVVNNSGAALMLEDGLGTKNRKLLPEHLEVVNNIFYNTVSKKALISGSVNTNIQWTDNLTHGASLGYPNKQGFIDVDPQFKRDGKLLRPQNKQQLQVSASLGFLALNSDANGQTTIDDNQRDQLSEPGDLNRPLSQTDVGPSWKVN